METVTDILICAWAMTCFGLVVWHSRRAEEARAFALWLLEDPRAYARTRQAMFERDEETALGEHDRREDA
jgi:hypothetical protein